MPIIYIYKSNNTHTNIANTSATNKYSFESHTVLDSKPPIETKLNQTKEI